MGYFEQILEDIQEGKKKPAKAFSYYDLFTDGTGTGTPVPVKEHPFMYDKFAEQYRAQRGATGNRAPAYTGIPGGRYSDEEGNTVVLPDMSYRSRMNAGTGAYREAMDEASNAYGNMYEENEKDVDSRIAQLDREISDIENRLKNWSVEEAMGKYKFLWEGDPSTLASYKQNMRSAEQTENIRKATEEASKASTIQQAWKQNGIDLEVARYDVAAAKNAYAEAKANNDEVGMRRANTDLERAQAKLNRVNRENEMLRGKVMDSLGITLDSMETLEDAGNGEGNSREGSGNLNDDIAQAEVMKTLDTDISLLDKKFDTDNIPIDKKSKAKYVKDGLAEVEEARKAVNGSDLSKDQKRERLEKLADLEKKIRNYAKPASKGGQETNKDKAYYQGELDNMTSIGQLVKQGYRWLQDAKKAGATHKYLEDAIKKAQSRK